MSKVRVNIVRTFDCAPRQLFAFLSEHESLARLFAPWARFKRLSDGVRGRNGVGSARHISVLGIVTFVETYTRVEENAHVEYVVSGGTAPITNHVSIMAIRPTPSGCELRYTSAFDGKFPLIAALIAPGLDLVMRLAFLRLSKIVTASA